MERKVLLLLLLFDLARLFSDSPVYTQNGCILRNLFFFKMGASIENFSSKLVYP